MNKTSSSSNALKKLIKLLAKEGVVDILLFIHKNGSARYKDLVAIISSEPTLVRRLNELTSLKILERRLLDEKYRPVEYRLTELGAELSECLIKTMSELEKIHFKNL